MKSDIFEKFSWHSSIGIDDSIEGGRRFVTRIPNTAGARRHFAAAAGGKNFLIHKTTKSLWKMSEDNKMIEPVFPTDILTEEQVKEIMEEDE